MVGKNKKNDSLYVIDEIDSFVLSTSTEVFSPKNFKNNLRSFLPSVRHNIKIIEKQDDVLTLKIKDMLQTDIEKEIRIVQLTNEVESIKKIIQAEKTEGSTKKENKENTRLKKKV